MSYIINIETDGKLLKGALSMDGGKIPSVMQLSHKSVVKLPCLSLVSLAGDITVTEPQWRSDLRCYLTSHLAHDSLSLLLSRPKCVQIIPLRVLDHMKGNTDHQ